MKVRIALLLALTLVSGSLLANSASASSALEGCDANKCVTIGGCSIMCNRCENKSCVYDFAE